MRKVAHRAPGLRVVVVDSVAQLLPEDAGTVAVTGSHGGSSAAGYAIEARPRAVFFNDAGLGKEDAGVAGLALLQAAGVAAGTVSHLSARIGDGTDSWESGVISRLNEAARTAGYREGLPLKASVLASLPLSEGPSAEPRRA